MKGCKQDVDMKHPDNNPRQMRIHTLSPYGKSTIVLKYKVNLQVQAFILNWENVKEFKACAKYIYQVNLNVSFWESEHLFFHVHSWTLVD